MMNALLEKFCKKVKEIPNNVVFESEKSVYTFKDIDTESECIRDFLISGDFKRNIGVLIENEERYIGVLLGIFKAGKTFLPLNLNLSVEKIYNKIKFHEVTCVLTDKHELVDNSIFYNISDLPDLNADQREPLSDNNIAYILSTSGTTGSPKSVMVNFDSLDWILTRYYEIIQFNDGDIFLLTAAYTFDLFFSEIFAPIYGRGKLFISGERSLKNLVLNLADIVNQREITHISLTPSMGRVACENAKASMESLRYVILVGEKLEAQVFNKFIDLTNNDCNIFNMYGPTETTIYSTYMQLKRNSKIFPIGQAFEGYKLLVLDDNMESVNEGQLYIGGKGLSEGYYKNDRLNSEKFVRINDELFFKSGDWVVKQGEIYLFLGRLDNQVKINGARVEIDEINEIISNAMVEAGVCGYFSTQVYENKIIVFLKEADTDQIRHFEKVFLNYPEYMRPLFVKAEEFIYNENGKLDVRKMLKLYKENIKGLDVRLVQILKEEYGCTSINELDSLNKMVFICSLEEKFNVILNTYQIYDDESLEQVFAAALKERNSNDEK